MKTQLCITKIPYFFSLLSLWFVVTEKRLVSNLQQDKFQQMSDQIITRNILLLLIGFI